MGLLLRRRPGSQKQKRKGGRGTSERRSRGRGGSVGGTGGKRRREGNEDEEDDWDTVAFDSAAIMEKTRILVRLRLGRNYVERHLRQQQKGGLCGHTSRRRPLGCMKRRRKRRHIDRPWRDGRDDDGEGWVLPFSYF